MDAACHPKGWVGLQGTHGDIQVPPYGARKESVKVDVGCSGKLLRWLEWKSARKLPVERGVRAKA